LHVVTFECQLISFYGCLCWFHILKEAMFFMVVICFRFNFESCFISRNKVHGKILDQQ
jgi:hypothetical protein